MNRENRQILLRRRPNGLVSPDDTEMVTVPAPVPAEGEALLRTTYVGIDAAARTWLDGEPGYLPALQLGEVVRVAGIGEVVESRCNAYKVGDLVTTLTGLQDYAIIRDDLFSTPVVGYTDPLAVMSIYGPTGATAYFGMTGVGKPQPGETVVVSAAAGATGSVAGQIAKIAGARVVGIAGGPEKCRVVVEEFGFDACVDYKAGRLAEDLAAAAPDGIDLCFENVGGPGFDATLALMNAFGRVALCGMIAGYDGEAAPIRQPGPILRARLRVEGFIVTEHPEVWPAALAELGELVARHELHYRETIAQGIERAPEAFLGMLKGHNFGKQLVALG